MSQPEPSGVNVNFRDAPIEADIDLGALDRKIKLVSEKFERLAGENDELKQKLADVENGREDLHKRVSELEEELESARENSRDKHRDDAIRKKVQALLKKLDQL